MFYNNLKDLCSSNNITVTALLKELGISTSKGTAWKNGSVPKGNILSKLASYFNVSTDYLLRQTDNPTVNNMATRIPVLFSLMAQRKITQKQLSVNIGVSEGNISDWKSGRAAPNIEVLPKIADYLNCSVDCLLRRTENPTTYKSNLPSSSSATKLLQYFESLNEGGQEKALERLEEMASLDRYKKHDQYNVAKEA